MLLCGGFSTYMETINRLSNTSIYKKVTFTKKSQNNTYANYVISSIIYINSAHPDNK